MKALERDEYRRATAGYAPSAELLFLDEIFKANSEEPPSPMPRFECGVVSGRCVCLLQAQF